MTECPSKFEDQQSNSLRRNWVPQSEMTSQSCWQIKWTLKKLRSSQIGEGAWLIILINIRCPATHQEEASEVADREEFFIRKPMVSPMKTYIALEVTPRVTPSLIHVSQVFQCSKCRSSASSWRLLQIQILPSSSLPASTPHTPGLLNQLWDWD